ncbi:MAG: hypothetical protein NVS3B10_11820 [Polyangiales bacterium]
MPLDVPLDLATLPPAGSRVIAPAAPAPMRAMAARGLLPGLRPEQIVTVLVVFALGDQPHIDDATRETAKESLTKLAPQIRAGALAANELPAAVLDVLALVSLDDVPSIERVVMHPAVSPITIHTLAKRGSEAVTELVAVNEERLLAHPTIIEALYMNKRTRMSTADRVLDLAVRNGKTLAIPAFKEAAEAILDELIAAPDAEPNPDDVLFREAQDAAEEIEAVGPEVFKETEEGEEVLDEKVIPLEQRVRSMTISQKIRVAMLGTASTRALLVRDKNRLVAAAVIRSPLIQDPEVAAFASSRSVSEDVLRMIGTNGEFTKSQQVKVNLVGNPKTPLAIAMRLLSHLRTDDLRKLSRSKNVTGQISRLAKQEMEKRKPGA